MQDDLAVTVINTLRIPCGAGSVKNSCSKVLVKICKVKSFRLGIKQIFTSFNNPKGNADTERMMRTMKEALIWSNDFESFEQLSQALDVWVKDYNANYLHSTLGYVPPNVFEKCDTQAKSRKSTSSTNKKTHLESFSEGLHEFSPGYRWRFFFAAQPLSVSQLDFLLSGIIERN